MLFKAKVQLFIKLHIILRQILRSKSADYCRQLGYEAKAKVLTAQSGEKQVALDDLRKQISAMEESGPQARTRSVEKMGGGYRYTVKETTDYVRLKDQEEALAKEVAEVTAQFEECVDAARAAADAVGASAGDSTTAVSAAIGTLADDVERYRKSVEGAVQANGVFGTSAMDADARLSAMKSGISALISRYGAENDSIKALIAEYANLDRARTGSADALTGAAALSGPAAQMQNTPKLSRPKETLSGMQEAVRMYRKLQEDLSTASPDAAAGIRKAMEKKRYCTLCGHEIKDWESHHVRFNDYGEFVFTCRRCIRRSLLFVMSMAAALMLLICLLAVV